MVQFFNAFNENFWTTVISNIHSGQKHSQEHKE